MSDELVVGKKEKIETRASKPNVYSSCEAMPLVRCVMWLLLVATNGDVGSHWSWMPWITQTWQQQRKQGGEGPG